MAFLAACHIQYVSSRIMPCIQLSLFCSVISVIRHVVLQKHGKPFFFVTLGVQAIHKRHWISSCASCCLEALVTAACWSARPQSPCSRQPSGYRVCRQSKAYSGERALDDYIPLHLLPRSTEGSHVFASRVFHTVPTQLYVLVTISLWPSF